MGLCAHQHRPEICRSWVPRALGRCSVRHYRGGLLLPRPLWMANPVADRDRLRGRRPVALFRTERARLGRRMRSGRPDLPVGSIVPRLFPTRLLLAASMGRPQRARVDRASHLSCRLPLIVAFALSPATNPKRFWRSTATGIRTRVSGLRIASAKPFRADLTSVRPVGPVEFAQVPWSWGDISGHALNPWAEASDARGSLVECPFFPGERTRSKTSCIDSKSRCAR